MHYYTETTIFFSWYIKHLKKEKKIHKMLLKFAKLWYHFIDTSYWIPAEAELDITFSI